MAANTFHTEDAMSDLENEESFETALNGTKRKRAAAQATHTVADHPIDVEATVVEAEEDYDSEDMLVSRPIKKPKLKASTPAEDFDNDAQDDSDEEDDAPKRKASSKKPKTRKPPRIPPPDHQIQALFDGVSQLEDWTSVGTGADHCKIIKWLDKDGLTAGEIAKKWAAMGYGRRDRPVENAEANIYKLYAEHAPGFYKEKGLVFASRSEQKSYVARKKKAAKTNKKSSKLQQQRTASKPKSIAPLGKMPGRKASSWTSALLPPTQLDLHVGVAIIADQDEPMDPQEEEEQADEEVTVSKPPRPPTEDEQLEELFAQTFDPPRAILKPRAKASLLAIDKGPSEDDITRFYANRNSKDLLTFRNKSGDAPLGDPSRPVLARQAATQYSPRLQEKLEHNPDLQLVHYEDSIDATTITRFIACISPSMRSSLPTHDLVEIPVGGKPFLQSLQIQWSMQELLSLYRFARFMGTHDICDMIFDRLHKELHRATRRMISTSYGAIRAFNILDFGPEFLNALVADQDGQGLNFFTDVIVLKKVAGWALLEKHGLDSWDPVVKGVLRRKLEGGEEMALGTKSLRKVCWGFHHHIQHRGECYRVRELFGPMIADVDGASESVDGVAGTRAKPVQELDPSNLYWERQREVHEEKLAQEKLATEGLATEKLAAQQASKSLQPQGRKRKHESSPEDLATLEERATKRRKEDEALQDYEDNLPSVTLNPPPTLFTLPRHQPPAITFPSYADTLHAYPAPAPLVDEFYPPELGNRADDGDTAYVKRDRVKDKSKLFVDFYGAKGIKRLLKEDMGKGKGRVVQKAVWDEREELDSEDDVDEGEWRQ